MTKWIGDDVDSFIPCECHAHALSVTRWDEDGEVIIELWSTFGPHKPWRERLKMAWRLLRGRWAAGAEVVLCYEHARQFALVLAPPVISVTDNINTVASVTWSNPDAIGDPE